uniref:U3 small nucleolar ribonucleoprotein protein imp4-like n=1 Tax=Hirondellea gigas TaxID=1518452 RepID=A0A6A7GDB1_9CRUS
MIISHLPYGPTCYFGLSNCVMRHDLPRSEIGTMSEAFPHLIFNNFNTKLGERFSNILKYLFPVPKSESRRVITFSNQSDSISFRHHVYTKESHKDVSLSEVGPRFEMKPYQITLGTLDMKDAHTEWVLRPYMNTAKKRKSLAK